MAALIDAAFRGPNPVLFLDSAAVTFKLLGRWDDAAATACMSHLFVEGEVEILMGLRAAWKRGETLCPIQVACRLVHGGT